jgi:hypothetical protein
MTSAYEKYLASVKAAEDKVSQPRGVLRSVSVSGPATVYSTAFLLESWAARDVVPGTEEVLAKAYGDTVARELTESSLRCVRNRSSYILSARPDLSVRVEPAAHPATNEDPK